MAKVGYRYADGHPQRRAAWVAYLREVGPVTCGCPGDLPDGCGEHEGPCTEVIRAGDPFHLGHNQGGVSAGDTGQDSSPWSERCNLVDAANKTNGKTEIRTVRYRWGRSSSSTP